MAAANNNSNNIANNSSEWSGLDDWVDEFQVPRTEMNQLIMDYLVTEGYKDAAEKFRDEAGLNVADRSASSDLTSDASLDDRISIRDSIQNGRIREAIETINDLYPELLDDKKTLHFHLLQQELIEIIRSGRVEDALTFAQEHLSEKGLEDVQNLRELERTLALLAFDKPQNSPFADLLQLSHRQKVASDVNSAILEATHRHAVPRLQGMVQLMLFMQSELDKKNVSYPRMTDIPNAVIEAPKSKTS